MNSNKKQKINLLGCDRAALSQYCLDRNEKTFRADQLLKWIHEYGHQDFSEMSNLSKAFRASLKEEAVVEPPELVKEHISVDGTRKWLLQLSDGCCIETVYIPEPARGTLCISSQVGCSVNCSFCSTAKLGFTRNLSIAEIVGQVWFAARLLSTSEGRHDRHITNVVLMGMGEPLLNLENVVRAVNLIMDDMTYSFSKHRVTISTAGIVPAMQKLSYLSDVSLAVSLHAPTNALRDQLVPANRAYPLEPLIEVCKRFFQEEPRRKVSFEYVMLKGINDSSIQAYQLLKLLEGISCKMNLIPFNDSVGSSFHSPSFEEIQVFANVLSSGGINTRIRKTRGVDIQAACGQLVGSQSQKEQ